MSTVEEIQIDIDEARSVIAHADALNRLMKNPDFIRVIKEGFFKEEAYRLVELKAAPQMQSKERRKGLIQAIDAIGGLQQHFNKIWVMAEQATSLIEQAEQELELMAEEGEV